MPPEQKASQDFVAVEKIERGIVHLKKGGVLRVIMVSGINFDLKSEDEQNLILSSFQNFLNTLDFGAQFFVHSRKVNIKKYLEQMRERREEEVNELLKIQIEEYTAFIEQFVEENQIINKSFFVVVPHHKMVAVNPTEGLMKLFGGKKKEGNEETLSEEETLQQLAQRVDQVVSGLEQIGLRAIPLEDEELIELYYNLYNPQLVERKDAKISELKQ